MNRWRSATTGLSFPLLLLACLAGMTWWLQHVLNAGDGVQASRKPQTPDLIVEGFRAISSNAKGRVQFTLSAKRMEYFSVPDRSVADQAVMLFAPPGEPKLTLTAATARMEPEGKTVYLEGGVRVVRDDDAQGRGWSLETDRLIARTDDERIESDQPFVFQQGENRLSGTGFTLDNASRALQIKHAVRGVYVPRQPAAR